MCVKTAKNSTLKFDGVGKFKKLDSAICQQATDSLLSFCQFAKSIESTVIFMDQAAYRVQSDDYVKSLLSNIIDHSSQKNQFRLTANMNNDSLYEITDTPAFYNSSTKSKCSFHTPPSLSSNGRYPSLIMAVQDADVQPTFSVFHASVNCEICENRDFAAKESHSDIKEVSDTTVSSFYPGSQLHSFYIATTLLCHLITILLIFGRFQIKMSDYKEPDQTKS